MVDGLDGHPIDLSRIPSPEVRAYDIALLTNLSAGWYAITNTTRRVGFGLVWPVEIFSALWYWQVFRGALGQPWYGRTYNIALEPWTTPKQTITAAIAHGSQQVIAAGEHISVTLKAVAYAGLTRVHSIDWDGRVEGRASATLHQS